MDIVNSFVLFFHKPNQSVKVPMGFILRYGVDTMEHVPQQDNPPFIPPFDSSGEDGHHGACPSGNCQKQDVRTGAGFKCLHLVRTNLKTD